MDQSLLDRIAEWAATADSRRRSGPSRSTALPPWDEMIYFDNPVTQLFTINPGGNPTPICVLNPHRVGLIISCPSGGPAYVSPNAEIPGSGVVVQTGTLPLVITQSDWGLLCQYNWFANVLAPATVFTIELLLREWRLP